MLMLYSKEKKNIGLVHELTKYAFSVQHYEIKSKLIHTRFAIQSCQKI